MSQVCVSTVSLLNFINIIVSLRSLASDFRIRFRYNLTLLIAASSHHLRRVLHMSAEPDHPQCVDVSVQRLFSQLLSLRLSRIMDSNVMESDDWSLFDSLPGSYPGLEMEKRLDQVEKTQARMLDMLQNILDRMDSSLLGCTEAAKANPGQLATSVLPVRKSHSSCSSSSSQSASSASPDGFRFTCPLCLRPQSSPKAHCEHMRNMAVGESHCVLDRNHDRHRSVLNVFVDSHSFVKW